MLISFYGDERDKKWLFGESEGIPGLAEFFWKGGRKFERNSLYKFPASPINNLAMVILPIYK